MTRLPQAPRHMLGMLNLRGSIVPVVDLRMRSGRAGVVHAAHRNCRACGTDTVRTAGVWAGRDSVSDVVDIDPTELRETPSSGSKASSELIKGLAAVADRMVILLNVEELIRRDLQHTETPAMAGAA